MNRYRVAWLASALILVAGAGTGCGGISGGPSVSPASFFLPGLIHHETPEPNSETPADPAGPVQKPLAS